MTTGQLSARNTTRLQAFLAHLGISFVVLLILLGIIFYFWYPHDFIKVGGVEGLMILAGVDLVIGPLLTLIIYNPRKRQALINLDLSCIAMAQILCILYGLSLIFPQRPLLQVLADDGVYIYTAAELKNYNMTLEPLQLPGAPPHHVVLDLPSSPAAVKQLKLVHEIINRRPFALSDELLVPAADFDKGAQVDRITAIRKGMGSREKAFIEALESRNDCTWVPIHSIHARGAGCYSAGEGVLEIAVR